MRSSVLPLALSVAACTQPNPPVAETGVPLRQLPADTAMPQVRADLIASARAKFGVATVEEAMAAPTFLVVKRFVGMAPPPPPGADPGWMPPTPTALLVRDRAGWRAAHGAGWRPLTAAQASRIDAIIGADRFWREAASVPPCPDFGASNVLLKVPGRTETVRNAMCVSAASELVSAALAE